MDIEKERGITIKRRRAPEYHARRPGYILNLMDTPATSTSPTRSTARWRPARARCWWSTLRRGSRRRRWPTSITRSTPATNRAVLNKVEFAAPPSGEDQAADRDVIGLDASNAIMISAKTGPGACRTCWKPLSRGCAAEGRPRRAAQRRCWSIAGTTPYLGVVVLVRIVDGVLKKGQRNPHDRHRRGYEVDRTGVFTPKLTLVEELRPGEIGMLTA